ncbi:NUDIX domain-containing protein [Streptomyces sp. SID13031]|uniref:NUDIX domain-containing protein n=1 Tax=Streptomyces sp. SID13031 TaxID=2706046 RepID=UPI0013CD5A14|nr:NUDIX domain-containing protein [Streptomyces sp. SID13031]
MIRAGVVLLTGSGLAAIERVRDGMTYYTLPGGGVEEGESPQEAARRESYEELGLIVRVDGLVAVVNFRGSTQYYYRAEALGGEFGTGTGEELASPAHSKAGSYRAVWIEPRQLAVRDVRPVSIAEALAATPEHERLLDDWTRTPLVVDEV